MKATLYEFMPYGAPELMDARRRHMSRALALSSATAIALYAVVMAIAPWFRHPVALEPVSCDPPRPPMVNPRIPEPKVPIVQPGIVPVTKPSNAPPVPVPDAKAPTDPEPSGAGSSGDTAPANTEPLPPPGPGPGEERPSPDAYIYVEHLPSPVKEVTPIYPDIAREAGIEGTVVVRAMVGRDGRVTDAVVLQKFSVPMLNEAALTAARQWVFTPGLAGGQPVACWVSIPFRFRLH